MRETTINETLNSAVAASQSHAPWRHSMLPIRSKSDQRSFRAIGLFVAGAFSVFACPAQRQSVADKVNGLEVANGSAQTALALETELRDSGIVLLARAGQHDRLGISAPWWLGCLPSAFELLGERRYVRAQAARQAACCCFGPA